MNLEPQDDGSMAQRCALHLRFLFCPQMPSMLIAARGPSPGAISRNLLGFIEELLEGYEYHNQTGKLPRFPEQTAAFLVDGAGMDWNELRHCYAALCKVLTSEHQDDRHLNRALTAVLDDYFLLATSEMRALKEDILAYRATKLNVPEEQPKTRVLMKKRPKTVTVRFTFWPDTTTNVQVRGRSFVDVIQSTFKAIVGGGNSASNAFVHAFADDTVKSELLECSRRFSELVDLQDLTDREIRSKASAFLDDFFLMSSDYESYFLEDVVKLLNDKRRFEMRLTADSTEYARIRYSDESILCTFHDALDSLADAHNYADALDSLLAYDGEFDSHEIRRQVEDFLSNHFILKEKDEVPLMNEIINKIEDRLELDHRDGK